MKSLLRILSLALVVALAQACEKSFLYEDQPNEPEAIFETVWQDLDENYSGFLPGEPGWENVYSEYRPKVTAETTESELWEILTEMLDELNDEHVKLYRNEEFFVSGSEKADRAFEEFSLELIANKYLGEFTAMNDYVLVGKIEGTAIGYLYIAAFLDEDPEVIRKSLAAVQSSELEALIVDVRNSVGGYDGLAAEYASVFSDGRKHLYNSQFKNGPAPSDFTSAKAYFSKPKSADVFDKPVILLTDAATASEAEIFTLHLRSFSQVIHMGDTTAGALSTVGPARFLANGWRYDYSIQRITNPEGSSFEKLGIPPSEYVQNSATDIQNGKDNVLEESLHFLELNFGI
jgi:C-terminal processing protease CtpA/Prc